MPVIPPPVLALAAGALQHLLAPRRSPRAARTLAAGAVGAASLGLIGATVASFRRVGTTVEPFDPEQATVLVTTGPNGLTRNPIYLGLAGVLTAHAIFRGGAATAFPVAGFIAAIDRLQIRPEESALAEVFGDAYAKYQQEVPRWVGISRLFGIRSGSVRTSR